VCVLLGRLLVTLVILSRDVLVVWRQRDVGLGAAFRAAVVSVGERPCGGVFVLSGDASYVNHIRAS